MKTSIKTLSLLASIVAMTAGAYANTLDVYQDTANYSNGNGGAFIIKNVVGGPINDSSYSSLAKGDDGILTFCIEENEYISPVSGTYNYSLNYGAVNGGNNGQTSLNYDGVSNATAYLYSQFARGLLNIGGFAYTQADLGDLQAAIWFLEGEGGSGNYLSTWATTYIPGALLDNNGADGVYAVNLTNSNGGVAQDQLYYSVEPNLYHTPDQGMTLALLGLALMGLVGFRSKFSR